MQVTHRIEIRRGHATLVGDVRPGSGATAVLLHPGVADRRVWETVAGLIHDGPTLLRYDRPGCGETTPPVSAHSDLDDLVAVLDEAADGSVVLVGSSAGGAIALDAALTAPERVSGLVLLAPAVSGSPEPVFDPDTERLGRLIDEAAEAGDWEEVNRLETWLWLDGPSQPEGRVTGPARELLAAMNSIVLANQVPESAGASGLDTWGRLEEIDVPVTVACGDLDVPVLVERSARLAARLPRATHRELCGVAHLPQLERPDLVAELIVAATPSRS